MIDEPNSFQPTLKLNLETPDAAHNNIFEFEGLLENAYLLSQENLRIPNLHK